MTLVPAQEPPPGLDWCASAVVYDGPGRAAITALKFRDGRACIGWMADAMVAVVAECPLPLALVTWVPSARARARGFDQGEALARAVARRLRLPARRLLTRSDGHPQTGRSAIERAAGPQLRARARCPSVVLVVDDVWTTGASLAAAAFALKLRGTATVGGVTVGRTLLKPSLCVTEGDGDGKSPRNPPSTAGIAAQSARRSAAAP